VKVFGWDDISFGNQHPTLMDFNRYIDAFVQLSLEVIQQLEGRIINITMDDPIDCRTPLVDDARIGFSLHFETGVLFKTGFHHLEMLSSDRSHDRRYHEGAISEEIHGWIMPSEKSKGKMKSLQSSARVWVNDLTPAEREKE
jgi:hypothetical protein